MKVINSFNSPKGRIPHEKCLLSWNPSHLDALPREKYACRTPKSTIEWSCLKHSFFDGNHTAWSASNTPFFDGNRTAWSWPNEAGKLSYSTSIKISAYIHSQSWKCQMNWRFQCCPFPSDKPGRYEDTKASLTTTKSNRSRNKSLWEKHRTKCWSKTSPYTRLKLQTIRN